MTRSELQKWRNRLAHADSVDERIKILKEIDERLKALKGTYTKN